MAMSTVSRRFRSADAATRATARNLRHLMRSQGVTPAALAWILDVSLWRALRLSLASTSWTLPETFALVTACQPNAGRLSSYYPEEVAA